jgi:dTDP-4-dehydrorhamnose 3,5-epimerase
MAFIETPVEGAFIIEPDRKSDHRGFFARLWCQDELAARGLDVPFVQCNSSFSHRRGTLRGLHYQAAPHEEVKLVQCVRGSVWEVLVDVRPGSPTFGRWTGAELTAENRKLMYVPGGCAHGYLTLEDASEVIYPVSALYHPEVERGIRWDDPRFAIEWPEVGAPTLSDKDRQWPDYSG